MAKADLERSILIVDDYKTMLRIVRNLLRQLGFEDIDEASDGGQALQRMRARSYDLVISDWSMQPMGGLDLLKEMQADRELRQVPFVMIAADGSREKVAAAQDAGASSYIVKPFNAATLKTELVPVIGHF